MLRSYEKLQSCESSRNEESEKAPGFVYHDIDGAAGWRCDSEKLKTKSEKFRKGEVITEKARGFVYHKVDLPTPDIDYIESQSAESQSRESRSEASLKSSVGETKSCLRTKTAVEWMAESRLRARPRSLYEDFWFEGELALCFAGPGAGKSVLAVQIAESVARGRPIDKCSMNAPAQQVLYVDLELDSKQFELRYSPDLDPFAPDNSAKDSKHSEDSDNSENSDNSDNSENSYEFSPNFHRSEIDVCMDMPEGCKRFEEFVLDCIEKEIVRTKAKVVVIDSIDRFNGEIMRNRDFALVMKRLRRMKAKYGLSILVLAHAPRRDPKRPITIGQTIAARTLVSFADNVFAIGECRWLDNVRYLKHIRTRSNDLVHTADHLPTFRLRKENGSFLSFDFMDFYSEPVHLNTYMNKDRQELSDRAKRLRDEGLTNRQIALKLEISLAATSRALHSWSPYDNHPKKSKTADLSEPGAVATGFLSHESKIAETVEQTSKDEPDISLGIHSSKAQSSTTPSAEAAATPPIQEGSFAEQDAEARTTVRACPSPVDTPAPDISLGIHSPHVVANKKRWNQYDHDPTVELDQNDIVCNQGHPMFGLKRRLDTLEREIFVAREHSHNLKPKIFYRYTNIPGRLTRCENLYNDGIIGNHVSEVTDSYEPPPQPVEE